MGMQWHLRERMAERGLSLEMLRPQLTFALGVVHLGSEAPADLSLGHLAELCRVLEIQPGELLSYTGETPEEQAERELANNLFYQSYLAYRQSREEEDR